MRGTLSLVALLAACSGGEQAARHVAEGKVLLAEQKYEAAAAALSKATAADKNSMEAWLQLGHAYRGLKQPDAALAAYVAAKKADRHAVAPHVAHAKVQLDLGRVEQAITELNLVIEMDPKNLEALILLGQASQMPHKQRDGSIGVSRLDLERAELNLQAAAALDPGSKVAAAELEQVRRKLSSLKEK